MTDYLKLLHDDMKMFAANNGLDIYKVYTSLIDYMIAWLDVSGNVIEDWQFSEEQNKSLYEMMKKVIKQIGTAMIDDSWCDPFGDIFMEYLGNKNLRGQCFTPDSVANLCSKIVMDDTLLKNNHLNMIVVNDSSCGSGRMLISSARYMELHKKEYIYCIGEDIDTVCVKQTAINLSLHGCYGEVVCHDSIKQPDNIRFGYIINEALYPDRHNRPSIRYCDDAKQFVVTRFWDSQKRKEPKQLNLFDI